MASVRVVLFISALLCLSSLSLTEAKNVRVYPPGGLWKMRNPNIGLSSMHMQLLHDDTVVIFDRTDVGISNLTLPPGKQCRENKDENGVVHKDCSAHSLLYDINTDRTRPLFVNTDTWCSSGTIFPDGMMVQTGGFNQGEKKIREFKPCGVAGNCDWIELEEPLAERRWYATNHILPDGRAIIVGGQNSFSYEFLPKDPATRGAFQLQLLRDTTDSLDTPETDNLYPAVHLMPDGNIFILANRKSISLDYKTNTVVRTYPDIPGEIRNYPCTGTSLLLPMKLNMDQTVPPAAEVMVCGGTTREKHLAARHQQVFLEAGRSCGRMIVTDPNPQWAMEDMPIPRVMPDMLNLPDGSILIINGARRGSSGWEWGDDPVFEPLIYYPEEADLTKRFVIQNPGDRARMYHSSALLLPDATIMISGSNPHQRNIFQNTKFPTDMTVQGFTPDYNLKKGHQKATIHPLANNFIKYRSTFQVEFDVFSYREGGLQIAAIYPSFSTHNVQMSQKMLWLPVEEVKPTGAPNTYVATVQAPAVPEVAPPGYYMLFVVNGGTPSKAVWVNFNN